jgi:FkbM family methyltransferase
MRRLLRQLSNDITFALASARRAYLYRTQRRTVGGIEGVIRDTVRARGVQCDISFRHNSLGDRGVVNQIFQQQEYAIDENAPHGKALRKYYTDILIAGRKPLILDAGANIGASCLYFACSYPGSTIVAIEPERNNCALLKANAEGKDIQVIEGAIGAERGTIFLCDPGLSDWGFRVAESGDYSVPVTTPVDILADYDAAKFTPLLCKIDIEGSEQQLFSGNVEWLDRFAVVVIELHDWMLPGRRSAQPFLKTIANSEFDFLHVGENVFCFNTKLLELS